MPPAGFEPAIPASERPQSHALDRAATGIGHHAFAFSKYPRNYKKVLHWTYVKWQWLLCRKCIKEEKFQHIAPVAASANPRYAHEFMTFTARGLHKPSFSYSPHSLESALVGMTHWSEVSTLPYIFYTQ
jgi:hypothetical protein